VLAIAPASRARVRPLRASSGPDMVEWFEAAKAEPDALEELDVEF
jgi:hypothetical protein